jgi:translation initiation factor 2 beta subunit (eIF-2beta)/eIF-5
MMNRYIQWKTNNPDSYKEVLRRRRERYAENEEFRERQLQHTTEWRVKQRKSKKGSKKRTPKPKIFELGGHQIECWSAGRTAEFLDVDKKTVTNLEKSGTIPTNHVVADNRRRWWPASFVRWLAPYFEQRKSEISAQEFHRRVWIGWSEEQVRGIIPVVSGDLLREETSDDGETRKRSSVS